MRRTVGLLVVAVMGLYAEGNNQEACAKAEAKGCFHAGFMYKLVSKACDKRRSQRRTKSTNLIEKSRRCGYCRRV